ncbi:MAG: hypothetical protein ACRD0G_18105 [Acidimicrobiales bacterium]
MAFVVRRPKGRFELREGVSTPRGPRSRTLASFKVLDDRALDRAAQRATKRFDRASAIAAAERAGARVTAGRADLLAGDLLIQLDRGRQVRPGLRRLLQAKLAGEPVEHHLEAMIEWLDVTPEERGRTLRDLLGLVDRVPLRDLPRPKFPHLHHACHG